MTPSPVTAHPGDLLVDAASRMLHAGIRHLPVVDGAGAVIGMLSDRDVRSAIGNPMQLIEGEPLSARIEDLTVKEIMTPEPRVVAPDSTVATLLALLVDERLGAVPVVDADEGLVGIVSYLDVLRNELGPRTAPRRARL
jgi:acetoin utilization protein AcuB